MEKLVSIITLCYNGEKYIDRYAKSLLDQDYHNCQLIFIDDGSTDNSKEKILSYDTVFKANGIVPEYHHHKNIGTGASMAEAVHYIAGEFLIWPDVDDTLAPESIWKKVNFLEKNQNYGIVRTDFARIYDAKPNEIVEYGAQKYTNRWKEDLFEDYLLSNQAWLQPGCYMMRVAAFLDSNPNRYIFPTRRGQNWQMLLPVLYKYKCGYIDEPLYNYFLHKGSLSDASKETPEVTIQKYEKYEELILDTLDHIEMPQEERDNYKKRVTYYYLMQKIDVCFRNGLRKQAKEYYTEMVALNGPDKKSKIKMMTTGTIIADIYLKRRG